MGVEIRLDTSVLDRMLSMAPTRSDDACEELAQELALDMQASFKNESPAPAGGPPGIDTGTLFDSIEVHNDGLARRSVWGAGYGLLLEEGTSYMQARPFIYAAALRIAKKFEDAFKVVVQP